MRSPEEPPDDDKKSKESSTTRRRCRYFVRKDEAAELYFRDDIDLCLSFRGGGRGGGGGGKKNSNNATTCSRAAGGRIITNNGEKDDDDDDEENDRPAILRRRLSGSDLTIEMRPPTPASFAAPLHPLDAASAAAAARCTAERAGERTTVATYHRRWNSLHRHGCATDESASTVSPSSSSSPPAPPRRFDSSSTSPAVDSAAVRRIHRRWFSLHRMGIPLEGAKDDDRNFASSPSPSPCPPAAAVDDASPQEAAASPLSWSAAAVVGPDRPAADAAAAAAEKKRAARLKREKLHRRWHSLHKNGMPDWKDVGDDDARGGCEQVVLPTVYGETERYSAADNVVGVVSDLKPPFVAAPAEEVPVRSRATTPPGIDDDDDDDDDDDAVNLRGHERMDSFISLVTDGEEAPPLTTIDETTVLSTAASSSVGPKTDNYVLSEGVPMCSTISSPTPLRREDPKNGSGNSSSCDSSPTSVASSLEEHETPRTDRQADNGQEGDPSKSEASKKRTDASSRMHHRRWQSLNRDGFFA